MSSIEQLITPQHVYTNIIEHLRSQLSVAVLDSSDLKNLIIDRVEVAAFGSRYHFSIEREVEQTNDSSLIILSSPTKPTFELVTERYVGYLEETLEPGANHPIFNFQAKRC